MMTTLDKSNKNSFTIVFCCIALFLSCQVSAGGQSGTSDDKSESASKKKNLVDTTHGYLSGSVEWISKKLDRFFSNETEFETATGSYLRVRVQAVRMEGGDVTYTTNLRSKLILPNTEKKLQLILRNKEEEDEESSDTSPKDAVTNNNYGAALRAILGEKYKYINIHTDAGVKLRSSLDPFVIVRLSAEKPLDKWKFRFIEKVSWYDSEGSSSYTSFDADRTMGSRSLFRSTSSITWREHQENLDLKQSFIIMNRIDSDGAAKFILTAYGVNEPVYRVENYVFSIVWRQNIYREWLFAQFRPLVQWSRTDDFDATPGIALQLEMTIGETN